MRAEAGDHYVQLNPIYDKAITPKNLLKLLMEEFPQFNSYNCKQIKNTAFPNDLLELEMKLMIKGYKFGIVYAKDNQKNEDEFFSNNEVGEDLEEFLEFIGDKIELQGYQGYAGGLDVHKNTTGKYALASHFESFSILFHVSTFLPFDPDDEQQVSRKRHIGNDIVVIVFQEKGANAAFDPLSIRSFFNQVYIVVRKDHELSAEKGKTYYRIAVSYKDGVEMCGPGLPSPPILEKGELLKKWFYTKLINCERSSYLSPHFSKVLSRTRRELLQVLYEKYYPKPTGGWT
uniref:Rap-GAP domain-containing protein n=1 Tax=Arcella intermedia TaxID=1963864 RepID=A0A6B2LBM5_9EUKA